MEQEEKILTRKVVEELGLNKLKIITSDMLEGYTSIGYGAFYSCYSLTSITIPNSVTSIGDSVFDCCFSLTSITIPNSIKCIEKYAFSYCKKLKNVVIGDKVYKKYKVIKNKCKQMNLIDCKKSRFEFLNETQRLFLCHFPMVSWWSMEHGSIMLHGHCHGRIDEVNESSPALRLDVGWDGRKNIWSLEEIIEYFNDKKIKFDNNNEIVHWRDGDGWHYNIKNDNINQIIEDLLVRQNYK